MSPNAGIIIIGNEILSGRTQDKNVQYIATKLTEIGVRLREVRVIPDDEQIIVDTVNHFRQTYSYVFTSGGIGPTHDDITADSIAKAFGVENKTHEEAYAVLLAHYGSEEEFTPARQRMAKVPEGATLVPNPVSAAPGFRMDNVYVMAGVPRIMQGMLDHIVPELKGGAPILSHSISCAIPESVLAEDLGAVQAEHTDVDIGSYPHFHDGNVGLSVVVRSTDQGALDVVSAKIAQVIRDHGGTPSAALVQPVSS